jgi:hypothetical protein
MAPGAKVLNFEGVIKKSRTDIIAQAGPVNSNQRFPDPFSSCYRYNIDIDDFIRGSSRIIHAKKFQLLSICSSAAIQPAAPLPQTVVDLSQVDLSHIEEDYRKSWKDTYCLDKAGLIFRWSGYLAVSTTALISGLGTANEIDPVTANLISTILTAGGGVLVWMGKSFDKHAVKSYETYKDLHTRQGLPAVTIRPYVNWEIEDPNGAKKTAV